MVLEVALFDVRPGATEAFAASYREAKALLEPSAGLLSIRMTQGVETPTRFVLLVEWDSVQAHDDFRASVRFPQWRALIGPHFAEPPRVEHFEDV